MGDAVNFAADAAADLLPVVVQIQDSVANIEQLCLVTAAFLVAAVFAYFALRWF